MIKKLLTYNPDDRISAEEALNDPWIIENTASEKREQSHHLKNPMMQTMMNNIAKINVSEYRDLIINR